MNFEQNWKIVSQSDEIKEGGQGKVYKVVRKELFEKYIRNLSEFINKSKVQNIKDIANELPFYISNLNNYQNLINNPNALKKIHNIENQKEREKAKKRLELETKVLRELNHPSLIKIIDYDLEDTWYVIDRFYSKGDLSNQEKYKNNLMLTLLDFSKLLEGIKLLHSKGIVHRDIKPENIFIDNDERLVLGDFGIIYFEDEQHTRISETYENVGSRDWQPPWATGIRIDEVKPSFDVFSLGKVLWSMLSGKKKLPYCNYNKPGYNLETLFPSNKNMHLINELLEKCITKEDEGNIKNTNELSEEITKITNMFSNDLIENPVVTSRHCKRCLEGEYRRLNQNDKENLSIEIKFSSELEVFICNKCGHLDMYSFLLK